jgi:rhamnose utilization protein RhaD (predicted bifunctional aldolase and dehydrogenase)/NAD(P)-dependent dehydrogenase (short-subunit alcohol dehydrogenase family)
MKNRWDNSEAKHFIQKYRPFGTDVALRTYSARLIGQEPRLVLHGGGNTSVKTQQKNITGREVPVLCIKGSGWDLASIEPAGHPTVKMQELLDLRRLSHLSDEDMVNVLRCNMLDSSGPNPSVETLLHAFLPHQFIDHTHADAVLAIADQPGGIKPIADWTKGRLGVVPYIMPGFALAQLASRVYEENPRVEGLILYKHGIFTFGDTAQQSYQRMIYWVTAAEKYAQKFRGTVFNPTSFRQSSSRNRVTFSDPGLKHAGMTARFGRVSNKLRGLCRTNSSPPMIVRHRVSDLILKFVNSKEAAHLSQRGPATPDHVIRTKPKPIFLKPQENWRAKLKEFTRAYQQYVKKEAAAKKRKVMPLDPLPRVALVPGVGLFALGADAKAAEVALDIYEHTIGILEAATRIGRYEVLSDADLFDMEYWSLEQAKLGKGKEKPFARKIVWISGAASGIGLETAKTFAAQGAHVFLTDRDERLLKESTVNLGLGSQAAFHACDVTRPREVEESFDRCSTVFGGVDIVVSNAGTAPSSPMKNCDDRLLRKSFEVNFFAHQNVAKSAVAVFERQGFGDCLLFNASKSAFNPGPDFGPYTLPKTAVIGLMKQYAIELAPLGIRSNAVNADRVRTHLFTEELLQKRAKARGVTIDDYFSANLLHKEVSAEDVAQAFLFLAQARSTTGTTLPVDGGNAAAFPR